METLLMVAVVLIALAIVTQAGVLIAMYLMSRRLAAKVDSLVDESKQLMPPLEAMTRDLKTIADDLAETGKIAREQVRQVQKIITDTQDTIRDQMLEVRSKVLDSVDEARTLVMRPIREYSAIASAISVGVRTFFSGRRPSRMPCDSEEDKQDPAA
jgi:hypothetical protein